MGYQEKLISSIVGIGECINHSQKGDRMGYANVKLDGKSIRLHRRIYCEHHNLSRSDINGLIIRHKCDNPKCINITHLEIGSHQDNMNDRNNRNRQAIGEKIGCSILKNEDVVKIREMFKTGKYRFIDLAKIFKVAPWTISQMVKRRTWKHIL